MKNTKNIMWVIALIAVIVLIGVVIFGYIKKATFKAQNPVVTMEVENFGTIKMELYPDKAPESVSNFIALANRGFYDGTKFHRVVKDFMIQTGSKNGDGTTGATLGDLKGTDEKNQYTITGEFLANGITYTTFSPSLTSESYNSACTQFFITTKETSYLNGYYAPFGKVIEGLDVVHKIEEVEVTVPEGTEENTNAEVSTPVNPPVVKSIRVETYGIDYGLPKTLTPFDSNAWIYSHYNIQ